MLIRRGINYDYFGGVYIYMLILNNSVLRRVAKSVIVTPGWNNEPGHPIVLVHGVYGSGKR